MPFTEFYKKYFQFGPLYVADSSIDHTDIIHTFDGGVKYYNKDYPGFPIAPSQYFNMATNYVGKASKSIAINGEYYTPADIIAATYISASYDSSSHKKTIRYSVTNPSAEAIEIKSFGLAAVMPVFRQASGSTTTNENILTVYYDFEDPITIAGNDSVFIDVIFESGNITANVG